MEFLPGDAPRVVWPRAGSAGVRSASHAPDPAWFLSLLVVDADQYKYGKNRVEADAKRLQSKEEELVRRKEALRTRLAQLRQERRDLRAAIEANAGRARAARPPGPGLGAVVPSRACWGPEALPEGPGRGPAWWAEAIC